MKRKELSIRGKWFLVICVGYLSILFVGSVVPIGNMVEDALMNNYVLDIRGDYMIHIMLYLPLAFVLWVLLLRWYWVVLIGALVTAGFEMVQMLLPYRSFNINDLVSNGAGFIAGLIFAVLLWRRFSGSEG